MSQRVGVVLAGGAGRRLGHDKAALTVHGVPLAQRAASVLWLFCGSVLISIAPGTANPAPDWPSVEDAPPGGRGPLAGILAAFAVSGKADLLVLACDYPRVGKHLIESILSRPLGEDDLVLPTDDAGRDHPLVALWSRRMEAQVRAAVDAGRYRVHSLFPDCCVRRIPPEALISSKRLR